MAEDEELSEYVTRVRSELLGLNVKRRITLGNFLLSSKFEDFNEKIRVAQKIRRMLITQWNTEMEQKEIDVVISPTTLSSEPQLQSQLASTS
jgi:Asp-tRNA(Asn)/Glu-tRNA(Gln) amidotransferase A subunit family amidase